MKLYDLASNYKNILDLDMEGEMITQALESIEEDITVKVENIAKAIRNIEADARAYEAEKKRFADKVKAAENKVESMKEYLKLCLTSIGLEKIRGELLTVALQSNPVSVQLDDEKVIPDQYFSYTKTPSKTAIKEALELGLPVAGASLVQTKSLRIR